MITITNISLLSFIILSIYTIYYLIQYIKGNIDKQVQNQLKEMIPIESLRKLILIDIKFK